MKFSVLTNAKQEEYSVMKKKLDKKDHLIVPVVMMVEGVHNGSHGRLLHLIEDLGKFPASWDGIPAVIDHPNVNGINVSANSPDILESNAVGRIFHTHVDGIKLMAEVWLEIEKLKLISPDTLSAVELKQPIEVSVGVFTEDEEIPGTWNGETYSAIARNHRPDHLALLPGAIGACSLIDGCGIRANQEGGNNVEAVDRNLLNVSISQVKQAGIGVYEVVDYSEKGLSEKLDKLRDLVRGLNPAYVEGQLSSEWNYLVEAYDTYLIYEKEGPGFCKYYKQNYQFTVVDDVAEFVGNPVEVQKKVEYEVVSEIEINTNKKEKRNMSVTPCVEKKVNTLIANEAAIFTEVDREMLQALTEEQLDKLVPKTIEVNKEVEVIKEVNVLSDEDKSILAFGRKQLKVRRDAHIAGIQANTAKDLWSEATLNAMDDDTLERVFKSVAKEPEVDFSLNGNRQMQVNVSKEEALYPAGVEVK